MKILKFFSIFVFLFVLATVSASADQLVVSDTLVTDDEDITCTYMLDSPGFKYDYHFYWYKNDERVHSFDSIDTSLPYVGNPVSVLPSSVSEPGSWTCTVYKINTDGGESFKAEVSEIIVEALVFDFDGEAAITPLNPSTVNDLTGTLVGRDNFVYDYELVWYRNGNEHERDIDNAQPYDRDPVSIISASETEKGDVWQLVVYYIDVNDNRHYIDQAWVAVENRAPIITSTPVLTGNVCTPYTYDVDATDADGDVLTYAPVGVPSGMTIDSDTGLINWTTPVLGTHSVTVRVTDGEALVPHNYTLNIVACGDMPPVVNLEAPADNAIVNTSNINLDYNVTDDVGVVSTDLIIDGVLVATDVTITMGVTQTYPVILVNGVYTWQVNATDTVGQTSSSPIYTLTVNSTGPVNLPPVLQPIANQTVNEGQTLTIVLNATDPENDTLTYGSDATFGSIVGNIFTWTPNYAESGVYTVTFNVTDGNGWDFETTTITVIDTSISGPVITSDPVTEAEIGEEYEYDVEAYDPAGCSLRYYLTEYPDGMEINRYNGEIEWTPKTKGDQDVRVRVRSTCTGKVAYQSFEIDVEQGDYDGNDLFIKHVQIMGGEEVDAGNTLKVWIVLENNAPADLDNLVMTVSIDDLGEKATVGPFDLDVGDKKSDIVYLDIPVNALDGRYDVRVVVSNDKIHRVKYRDVYVHGDYVVESDDVGVNFYVNPITQMFNGNQANTNWLAVFFVLLVISLLSGAIWFFLWKLKEREEELEIEPEIFTNF